MRLFCVTLVISLSCAPPRALNETAPLGLNDVSLLLPLPVSLQGPPILRSLDDQRAPLVPRAIFDRLVSEHGDVVERYESFHVVAVRFDLCDRAAPGSCSPNEDGRLRLVLQPLLASADGGTAVDVALHAFYPITARELSTLVNELRALSRLGGMPADSPLAVNAPLSNAPAGSEYAERLRALVERHAREQSLMRLTLFAQTQGSDGFSWVFRGLVRDGATFADIRIATLGAVEQRITLMPDGRYISRPAMDTPAGFALALDPAAFADATDAMQENAAEALAATDNPTLNTAETVPCASCHLATIVAAERGLAGKPQRTRFETPYPVSVDAGEAARNDHALRGFGWLLREPLISQRVANDSAAVVAEIEARWPVP